MSPTEGPEDRLCAELLACLEGRELPSAQWKATGDDAARTLADGYSGSCNIPLLSSAVWLYQQTEERTVQSWIAFFTASKKRFMGIEAGSRIYVLWHLIACASVAQWALKHDNALLASAALDWCQAFIAFLRELEAPDGTILLVGQRSAGHPPTPGLIEWVYAEASGGDTGRAESWCKQNGVGLRKRFEFSAVMALLSTLRRAANSKIPPEPHEFQSPYHIVKGDGFMAVWTERNLNANTPPVLGVLWTPDKADWFPANGGARIREQFDHATMELASDGQTLIYDSSLYGHAERRLPVRQEPAGDTISPPGPNPQPAPNPPVAVPGTQPGKAKKRLWWRFW